MSLLEIQDLKVEFEKPDGSLLPILDIKQFKLEKKKEICVKGHSGSGKSTLLNVISGILTPASGSVHLDGVDLTKLPEVERDLLRGKKIGFVFQSFHLLSGFTALENVILGSVFAGDPNEETSTTKARASQLLEQVGLADRIHYRPRMLSAGEQQRVAIARALINRPQLILADEPTGSLDEENSREVLDLILKLAREAGASLLLVTHDPDVMARFSKMIDLKEVNRVHSSYSHPSEKK